MDLSSGSYLNNRLICSSFTWRIEKHEMLNASIILTPLITRTITYSLNSLNFSVSYSLVALYKMALTFESVDKFLTCDHSNESY